MQDVPCLPLPSVQGQKSQGRVGVKGEGRDTRWPGPLLSYSLTPDVFSPPCCQQPTKVDGASSGWAGPVAPSALTAQPSNTETPLEMTAYLQAVCLPLMGDLCLCSLGFGVWAVCIWSIFKGPLRGAHPTLEFHLCSMELPNSASLWL